MFNVGFGEMLIFVTGASFLLGRQELMLGARYAGKLLGRAIGTMHGLKANYEANNAKNDLQTLHTSVRSGLRGEILKNLIL
jgi:Sec-independent protein translocase protein TatA